MSARPSGDEALRLHHHPSYAWNGIDGELLPPRSGEPDLIPPLGGALDLSKIRRGSVCLSIDGMPTRVNTSKKGKR